MNRTEEHRPMTMGSWMITMLILAIPLVNLFMLFYWAFTTATNPCKRTYCQAILMFALIAFGIGAILAIISAALR